MSIWRPVNTLYVFMVIQFVKCCLLWVNAIVWVHHFVWEFYLTHFKTAVAMWSERTHGLRIYSNKTRLSDFLKSKAKLPCGNLLCQLWHSQLPLLAGKALSKIKIDKSCEKCPGTSCSVNWMPWWAAIVSVVLHPAACVQDYAYIAVIPSCNFSYMILLFFLSNKLQRDIVT